MAEKITNARKAADLMRLGGILARMNTSRGPCWFIVPGGEVSAKVATELLNRPDVQPNSDGLFPGLSQTFRLGAAVRITANGDTGA
jgi:hypothetical protein